jgi:hypothetical protein
MDFGSVSGVVDGTGAAMVTPFGINNADQIHFDTTTTVKRRGQHACDRPSLPLGFELNYKFDPARSSPGTDRPGERRHGPPVAEGGAEVLKKRVRSRRRACPATSSCRYTAPRKPEPIILDRTKVYLPSARSGSPAPRVYSSSVIARWTSTTANSTGPTNLNLSLGIFGTTFCLCTYGPLCLRQP